MIVKKMIEIVLDDSLYMTFPESFHELDQDERNNIKILFDGEWRGMTDPDRHILITAGWKKINGLSAMLLSSSEIAKNSEKQIRKPMQRYGYAFQTYKTRKIDGAEASGFAYTYNSEGTDMYGETYIAKFGRTLYYFHMYSRETYRDESSSLMSDILGSVRKA